jgi:hypothetical protein
MIRRTSGFRGAGRVGELFLTVYITQNSIVLKLYILYIYGMTVVPIWLVSVVGCSAFAIDTFFLSIRVILGHCSLEHISSSFIL